MATVGSKPSAPKDLSAEVRSLLESVERKLRGYTADISAAALPDQLQALHSAMEELHVASENLQGQSEALAGQRDYYASLFEFSPDGYVVTDAYGNIRQVNLVAQRLLRFGVRLLVGKPLQ